MRPAVVLGATLVGVVLLVVVLRPPGVPVFSASGSPLSLPAPGTFPARTADEFEGILVGAKGRPVVVNIWASWCAPCRTEMPLLQRAADTYAGRAVVLGIASIDEADAARAFLDDFDITYPNIFDVTGEIRVRLGLTAYPTTYVFDATGKLRARVIGGISEQRLAALLTDASR